ncbi:MAG: hypothetical protein ACLUD2_12435 [Clostridium sp.]
MRREASALPGNLNLYLAQLSAGAAVVARDLFDPGDSGSNGWKHTGQMNLPDPGKAACAKAGV